MKSYTLTLTEDQVNLVGNALVERPYKEVANVLAILQQQVAMQQASGLEGTPKPETAVALEPVPEEAPEPVPEEAA